MTAKRGRGGHARWRGWRLDAAGALLLAALVAWAAVVAHLRGGSAEGYAGFAALATLTWGASRVASAADPRWVPGAVAATAATVGFLRADTLLASPLGSPLGYANATAAFFVLASAAAATVALDAPNRYFALGAWAVAIGTAAVPWLNGSSAGAAATLVLGAGVVLAGVGPALGRRRVIFTCLALALAAHGATLVMALACGTPGPCLVPRPAIEALSLNRLDLWADAVEQLRAEPVTGVGPGRFAEVSATASADADLPHAHGELLQLGAELGLVGLGLGTALVVWLYVMLSRGTPGRSATVAAAALTGLLLQAGVDYILHFPAVVATAVALTAAGMSPRRLPRQTFP